MSLSELYCNAENVTHQFYAVEIETCECDADNPSTLLVKDLTYKDIMFYKLIYKRFADNNLMNEFVRCEAVRDTIGSVVEEVDAKTSPEDQWSEDMHQLLSGIDRDSYLIDFVYFRLLGSPVWDEYWDAGIGQMYCRYLHNISFYYCEYNKDEPIKGSCSQITIHRLNEGDIL